MDLRATYNRIARDWFNDHQADDWWIAGTDQFISLLPKGASVLDVGCGAGIKSRYLSDRGLKVLGIDFAEKFIEIAREECPGIEFQVADMRAFDADGRRFDGVFAQASLLHIPKEEARGVLAHLALLLKSGGLLYVAVKEVKPGRSEEEVKKEDDYGYPYERFFSYYTLPELKEHFRAIGLSVIYEDVRLSGKTNWIQVVGRK